MRNEEVENKNVKKNFTTQEKTGHKVNKFSRQYYIYFKRRKTLLTREATFD